MTDLTPLADLPFPVKCCYADCEGGPFNNAVEVDEHITEEHLPQAIWSFAEDFTKEADSAT